MRKELPHFCSQGALLCGIPTSITKPNLSAYLQTPVMFTGSVRFNLAPFGGVSDADLWQALRRSHLADVIEAHPAGLNMQL